MVKQRCFGMLLFVGVLSIFLLVNTPLTHSADCISDWVAKNPTQGSITAQELSDIKCIFDWFETSISDVYYPKSNTISDGSLAYRYYAGSSAFLFAWKTTSIKIAYLGPLSANCIMELGTVDFWKATVCKPFTSITPGLWTGSNFQFFVSLDGTKITSTGSSIIKDGKAYSVVVGPNDFENVGSCGNILLRTYLMGELPIQDNAFAGKTSDGSIAFGGKFSSGKSSSGTYSVNFFFSECGASAKGSGSWSATPSGSSSLTESDGQSNKHEIVAEDMIVVIEK